MKLSNNADVVICGAGSAGVAAAYFLAQNSITNVVIIDKNPPLSQTSAKSGENYRNWWPDNQVVHFMNRSIDIMEALAKQSGDVFNMTRRGYLYVSSQPAHELQGYIDYYGQLDNGNIRVHDGNEKGGVAAPMSQGYIETFEGADILSNKRIIQQAFPHFSETIETAVHARRAGDVSAQQLGMYLLEEAKKLGVRFLRGEVTDIETDPQGIKAVEVITDGRQQKIETRSFINAAGPFVPEVASLLHIELPMFSVLQQKIAIQDSHGVLPRNAPFTIFMDKQMLDWTEQEKENLRSDSEFQWLLNEFPGGLHIKPEGGIDSTWIKLGWAINDVAEPPRWETEPTPAFTDMVLRGAMRFIPGLRQYIDKVPKPMIQYGGYYTKTKENLPLIGPMGLPGAYMVGALSGFGTMASCAAGELIAAWVAGSDLPAYANYLSLSRYDSPIDLMSTMNIYQKGEL